MENKIYIWFFMFSFLYISVVDFNYFKFVLIALILFIVSLLPIIFNFLLICFAFWLGYRLYQLIELAVFKKVKTRSYNIKKRYYKTLIIKEKHLYDLSDESRYARIIDLTTSADEYVYSIVCESKTRTQYVILLNDNKFLKYRVGDKLSYINKRYYTKTHKYIMSEKSIQLKKGPNY